MTTCRDVPRPGIFTRTGTWRLLRTCTRTRAENRPSRNRVLRTVRQCPWRLTCTNARVAVPPVPVLAAGTVPSTVTALPLWSDSDPTESPTGLVAVASRQRLGCLRHLDGCGGGAGWVTVPGSGAGAGTGPGLGSRAGEPGFGVGPGLGVGMGTGTGRWRGPGRDVPQIARADVVEGGAVDAGREEPLPGPRGVVALGVDLERGALIDYVRAVGLERPDDVHPADGPFSGKSGRSTNSIPYLIAHPHDPSDFAAGYSQVLATRGTVIPSACWKPCPASKALRTVGYSGVPEPLPVALRQQSATPRPVRSHTAMFATS